MKVIDSDIYPHKSLLTVNLRWRPFTPVDGIKIYSESAMEKLIVSHMLTLAKRACNGTHMLPIVGYNYAVGRKPHYHAVLLSEKHLDFDKIQYALLNMDNPNCKEIYVDQYDGRGNALTYTDMKHTAMRSFIPFCSRKGHHACKSRNWKRKCPYVQKFHDITKY